MKVTVVTMTTENADIFVGVLSRTLTEEERQQLAKAYNAWYGEDYPEEEGPERELSFRELGVVSTWQDLRDLSSHSDTGVGGGVRRDSSS